MKRLLGLSLAAAELVRRISAEATARLSLGRRNQFVDEAGAPPERT